MSVRARGGGGGEEGGAKAGEGLGSSRGVGYVKFKRRNKSLCVH